MRTITPITKIVNKLKRTRLGFTRFKLKEKYSCDYCAEGVLLKGILPKQELEGTSTGIAEVITHDEEFREKVNNAYGVDFSKDYEKSFDCIFESSDIFNGKKRNCGHKIYSLSYLIFHINDNHSSSHKETAEKLELVSKQYDLITGEKK